MKKQKLVLTTKEILDVTSNLTLQVLRFRHFKRVGETPAKISVVSNENTSPNLEVLVNPHKKTRPVQKTPSGKHFFTPENKTSMYPLISFGPFLLLIDQEIETDDSSSHESIYASYNEHAKHILKDAEEKNMTTTFTLDDVEKVKLHKKKNEGKREISQEEAMIAEQSTLRLASANEIARKSGLSSTDQKSHEWNHLVAYRFIGEPGQHAKNLVLATIQCNSLMMIIEEKTSKLLRLLAKTFPDNKPSITLNVKAETIPGTHIATCIHYHIMAHVGGHCVFNLKVKFDPKLKNEPPRTLDIYVTALFNYALKQQGKLVSFDSPLSKQKKGKNNDSDSDIRPSVLEF